MGNSVNNGRCGICGDRADFALREHEAPGGKYANGIIVKDYAVGQIIEATIEVTANHLGSFTFKICPSNNVGQDPNQECFDKPENLLRVVEGNTTSYALPSSNTGRYTVRLQLPEGLECGQCIIQWTYKAGNNWGICEDGSGALGCGAQEHFRACADVRIGRDGSVTSTSNPISTTNAETSTGTPEPSRSTSSSTTESTGGVNCKAVGAYASMPAMMEWCNRNCNWSPPYCPASHCSCE